MRPVHTAPTFRRAARSFIVVLLGGLTVVGGLFAVLPSASARPSLFAQDGFSRQVVNGWGSADTGGAYTLIRPSSIEVGVSGAAGYERMAAPSEFSAQLKAVNAGDVTI